MGQLEVCFRCSSIGYPPSSRLCRPRILKILTIVLLLGCAHYAKATPPSLTFQGLVQTLSTGGSITLGSSASVVVDPAGDIFVADTGNNRIVEVNAQGTASVLTISGLSPALSSPSAIALDGSGDLYIADQGNSRVVEVSPSRAGSVVATPSITLNHPQGVALDPSGNLYIADTNDNRIVKVTSGGVASALAIAVSSGSASLASPLGLAVDVSGKLYIADSSHNRVVTVAAGSTTGVVLSTTGLSGALSSPSGVAVDRVGNVYIADTYNSRIAEVDTTGAGHDLLSSTYLQATELSYPLGVAIDNFGAVYIANTGASPSQILIVDPVLDADSGASLYSSSLNKTAVGFGHISLGSSTPTSLILNFSVGAPVEALGGVKVLTAGIQGLDYEIAVGENTTCNGSTESGSTCTVQVEFLPTAPGLRNGALVLYDSSSNPVLTLPLYGFGDAPIAALAPNLGTVIGTGAVPLVYPFQVALDGMGNIYVANDGGGAGNLVKIPAGGGTGSVVPPGGQSFGGEIDGVALDGAGNLFVSDHANNRIVVITPGGVASVLTIGGSAPALSEPTALAFDGAGNLYISDYGNGRIVEVSSLMVAGTTSRGIGTVIGTGSYTTTTDGITGVAVDPMGNIYIPDGYQFSADPSRVIKVTAAGVVSLLTPTGITFSSPEGVGIDGMGNIYIDDAGHNRIVEITTAGVASVLTINGLPSPTSLSGPFGVTVDPFGNLYIPDSLNSRLLFVNVSGSALMLPTTAQGATSASKTATVTNLGNQALVFSANPTYTANFSLNSGDTNPCTSSTSLLAGLGCDVSVVFTPQSVGSLSAGITVTNNDLNVGGATQLVAVSGTSFSAGDNTATSVAIAPTSLANGQTATITATVTDTTHSSTTPTGHVTFTDTVGSTTISLNGGSAVNLSAGAATLTGVVLSGIGTHTIAASYAGVVSTFLTSSGTKTVVLSKATVTVAGPGTQPVAVSVGQAGTAIVTITGPYTTIAAPSGTISYSILNASSTSVASGTPTLVAGATNSTAAIPIPSSLVPGNYTINVTYSGDGNYLLTSTPTIIQVTVGQITPSIGWTPGAATITYGASLSGILNASALSGSTPVPGTFAYTATPTGGSASAVTNASVLSAGHYTLTATFTPSDTTTYSSVSSTVTLQVSQATPSITWATPSAITYGTALSGTQLNASSPVAGTFVYTPVSGTVEAVGSQTLNVTFTPTDTTDYATATAHVTLTVNQATPSITWATPAAITYGAALSGTQLNASSPVAGTFVYTPALGTIEAVGSRTLNVTFTPTDTTDYATATAHVTLTVNQATPSITWATPAAITYGAALSATQLNASSPVAGTFVYTPASGTIEAVGSQTLNVTFTPTDTADYASATAHVTLAVNKATPTVALVSSLNPVLITNAVTFTATVATTAGKPSGSVSFFDSTTLLGSVAVASGSASYTTSSLAAATHSITAVYSGDANFASSTSSAVAELVQDYSLGVSGSGPGGGSSGGNSQTAVPGGTATYTLALGPSNGATFPAPVTLSLSGLPPGATGTISPNTLPAGSTLANVTLTIQLPQVTARLENKPSPGQRVPPVLWGLLLLPFASKLRRAGKRLGRIGALLLLLLTGVGATIALSGCGSANGFFGQPPQSYTVTITATSGTVSRSTTVNLTVE
jgi:DNA-binding beta-propeller fold protein YncE